MKTLPATVISCALTGAALAGNPPGSGQPGVECEDIQPGQSASPRDSPFNENGIAGTVYAGEQAVNSKNPKSVSQYDVACFRQEARRGKTNHFAEQRGRPLREDAKGSGSERALVRPLSPPHTFQCEGLASLAGLEVLQKAKGSLQKGRGQVNATTRGMRLLNGWTKNTANVPDAARPGALTEQLVTSVSVGGAQRLLGG